MTKVTMTVKQARALACILDEKEERYYGRCVNVGSDGVLTASDSQVLLRIKAIKVEPSPEEHGNAGIMISAIDTAMKLAGVQKQPMFEMQLNMKNTVHGAYPDPKYAFPQVHKEKFLASYNLDNLINILTAMKKASIAKSPVIDIHFEEYACGASCTRPIKLSLPEEDIVALITPSRKP
jgi:hypothetical protein